jgi:hypothetical protein
MAAKPALEIQTKKSFRQESPRGRQRAAQASQLCISRKGPGHGGEASRRFGPHDFLLSLAKLSANRGQPGSSEMEFFWPVENRFRATTPSSAGYQRLAE